MPFEKFDLDEVIEERRKTVGRSLTTKSPEELRKLTDEIFHYSDDPWRATYLHLVTKNPGTTFYHAVSSEGAVFLYSPSDDKGMWYLPGSGMGPLLDRGLRMMRDAIARKR